jgi:2-oxoglutarate dehydrogenase E1 component
MLHRSIARASCLSSLTARRGSKVCRRTQAVRASPVATGSSRTYAAATKPQSVPLRNLSETFLDGTSANYVEEMYDQWLKDPASVHSSWASYFKNVESGAPLGAGYAVPPTIASANLFPTPTGVPQPSASAAPNEQILLDHMKLMLLIRAYQVRGHVLSKIDPLELMPRERPPELQIGTYGFSEADLEREFFLSGKLLSGILSGPKPKRPLREIIRILEQTYCGSIGVEYMHIQDRLRSNWIRERFETEEKYQLSKEQKINLIDRLAWATLFEQFLSKKFATAKRCVSALPRVFSSLLSIFFLL